MQNWLKLFKPELKNGKDWIIINQKLIINRGDSKMRTKMQEMGLKKKKVLSK